MGAEPLAQSDAPYAHFRFELHGSIALLRANDPGSLYWLSETAPEDAQWYGEALVVEHRYVYGVADVLAQHGWTVQLPHLYDRPPGG
jgi:hypothetical protein